MCLCCYISLRPIASSSGSGKDFTHFISTSVEFHLYYTVSRLGFLWFYCKEKSAVVRLLLSVPTS